MKLLFATLLIVFAQAAGATEIWVSPSGSDVNPGTLEQPLASVQLAMRKARELRRVGNASTNEPLKIILRGGTYRLISPLLFRFEDSATEGSPTVIEAATGERPVLSGGMEVTDWKKLKGSVPGLPKAARGNVWVAAAPRVGGHVLEFRQLWVKDRKAVRARTPNGDSLNRLLVWDRKQQQAWIPAVSLAGLRESKNLEMVFHQQWEIAICRVKSLRFETNAACVTFHEPEGKLQFEHPWPQPVMSTNGNGPFYLVNAMEFLDEPGEWFQELPGGKVYYWPRPGEDMTNADAIAPYLETLVEIEGTLDQPVAHIQFKNIGFSHTAWMRPARAGHVPLQAGMFMLDAYKLVPHTTSYHRGLDNQAWLGRAPGAVSVSGANHLRFERCRFEHLGFSGLDLVSGTHDDVIEGCIFRDIGGNGIQVGKFSDPGIETHRPYNPSDEREIVTRERIANNLLTDCANEDWGCVGILAGWVRGISIEHNELSNLSYTGISVGWGWNKRTNCMSNNRIIGNNIHHVATRMGDTAGIYTLSPQPGSLVAENSVHSITMSPYVADPEHWFYLYTDEGSSYITVRDNWCPEERFLKNANGPGCVWTNNGPMVSVEIKNSAGLQPEFRDLLLDGDSIKNQKPTTKP